MKEIRGITNRILEVDLSNKAWSLKKIDPEDRRMYLGGKGLGLKIYHDMFSGGLSGIDPLGEENPLIFMAGVLTGTGAVCSARFAGVTKSPLTGIMVTSSCGGPFGGALKTAGYDGLIIKGKSDAPVYIEITDNNVIFHEAGELWGMMSSETQKNIAPSGKDGDLVIGPAGENGVLYANIMSGHRFLGRAGMGAVMGSKKLKAVLVRGRAYRVRPVKEQMFKKVRTRASGFIAKNSFSKKYRSFGTASNVLPGIEAGYVPVTNFKYRTDRRFEALSGEAMAERYRTKSSSCVPCSIQCGHKGTFPDGEVKQIPEYETVGLWGPNIDNYNPDLIGEWNLLMNDLGMDTISAGGTVSWAMEAGEKGLRETELSFGKTDNISKILADIAYRRGEGAELALGSKRLSERYGGKEFAIHVKGLEMAAYDPRGAWGQGLNYAVANRGACHLSAYPLALEVLFKFLNPYTTKAKAFWIDFFENFNAALNSLQTCQFTSFAYVLEPFPVNIFPSFMLKIAMQYFPGIAVFFLNYGILNGTYESITGIPLSQRDFITAGRRIHVLERYMNTRMGISAKDDTLPARFLTEADTGHPVKKTVDLGPMLKDYYRIKGYDRSGKPDRRTLRKLGIIDSAEKIKSVKPGRKFFKELYVRIMLFVVGRAISAAAAVDPGVKKEFEKLPGNFSFSLGVAGTDLSMKVVKDENGAVKYAGKLKTGDNPALKLELKSLEAAMLLFTFRESTATSLSRDRITADGNIPEACAVVRILNIVEIYLLPKVIAELAVKRYVSPENKHKNRVKIYLRTLLG